MNIKLPLLLFFFGLTLSAQTIHYVKADATGDGSSWANASGDLQLMINNATDGDQIWVAQGTYKPERLPGSTTITPNHRDNAFLLKSGVSIYGSFAGNELAISQRVYGSNATVLSGDYLDNDQFISDAVSFSLPGNNENAHHLLIGLDLEETTVVDGLSFMRANANIFQNNSNISINGYTVKRDKGAGLYLIASAARFNNLTFRECFGYGGGAGMYLEGAATNLAFTNVIITYCRTGNEGSGYGIGIAIHDNAYAKFANLVIARGYGRCAVSVLGRSIADISNATFTRITTNPFMGVIIVNNAHLNIYNSLFILNSPIYDIQHVDTAASSTVKSVIGLGKIHPTAVTESVLTQVNLSFVDIDNLNFNLPHYSQAIGFGNATHLAQLFPDLTTDIEGRPRVMGSNIDLGAFEYDYNYCYPPVVLPSQDMCVQDGKVSNLYAVGFNIKWYDSAEGGTPLAPAKRLISGNTYYATSGNGVCESIRVPVIPNLLYCGSKIVDTQCNVTVNFNTLIYAEERVGATAYRFTVTGGGEQQVIDRAVRYFRLKDLPNYNYDTTYTINVAVFGNGDWFGNEQTCNVHSPALPATKVIASQCGGTFTALSTAIYADEVALATGYRFRVTDGVTTQLIEKPTRVFNISNITGYSFGKTYTVDVAVKINGNYGAYGAACTISTAGASTQLSAGYCGMTITSFGTAIYADNLTQATAYRFKVSDGTTTQVIEKPTRVFTISNFTGYTYGKTYTVQVAASIGGNFGSYGPSCTVTTMPQPLTQLSAGYCGVTVPTSGSALYANEVALATSYRFRVTADGNTYTIDRPTRVFSLSRIPGFAYGVTYSIEVTALVNGVPGEYGPACTATAQANITSRFSEDAVIVEEALPLNQAITLTAYPNPYTDVFSIEINTQSQDKVTVRAFDMTGKLVDDMTVSPEELASQKLGSRYAAGIYNVIVVQGDYNKSFKVMKQ